MSKSKGKEDDEAAKIIEIAISKLREEDYSHRGFLKPIEIALRTHKTEIMNYDSKLKPTSLPNGLKIAVKSSITDNKYTLHDVKGLEGNPPLKVLQEENQDNMLSLMKEEKGLQLAVCICMYSEDKKMLKSTLAGVAENIANLVAYEKMDPDKVGVFVMMDGIEKVDSSVIEYFQEAERASNINLGDNIAPSLTMEEMAKRAQTMTPEQINEQELKNINNFLFNPAELVDRNERRFSRVRDDYDQVKKLLSKIQELKKQKPLFDDLPNKLRLFFINEARELRKKQYAMSDEEARKVADDKLIEEYATDIRRAKPMVMKALQEGERYCKEYIGSRQDLAYLAVFRNKIRINYQVMNDKQGKKYQMNEYQDSSAELLEEITEDKITTYMNLFMCVKYKNSGKLSSHNWFFNGFCKQLRPSFAVLLDVGLRPEGTALMKMYAHMKKNPKVGGVCGYMSLKIEKIDESEQIQQDDVDCLTGIMLKFADIQRTQQVEYHFAHLMDKPFEASFGFIHVLPGAFSAYNMEAIVKYDDQQDDVLLKSYFKSIDEKLANSKIQKSELSIGSVLMRTLLPDFINQCCVSISPDSEEQMLYNENIYLAEDRILCMGIHKKGFDMTFLPDAYAEVDPIKTVHGLLGQRKRWINGSFFAFEKVKKELAEHQKQKGVECMLHFQMFYLTLMNALSYFSPAFFLFTVHIAMQAFRADVLTKILGGVVSQPNTSEVYNAFVYTMDFIYVMLVGSVIFFSLHLTNSNKKFKPYIYAVSTLFGLFSIAVFGVLVVDVFRGLIDKSAFLIENTAMAGIVPGGIDTINILRWILIASTIVYVVPILTYIALFRKANILWEIILGAFSFMFYGPTYLNILNIYSLCRIDDISWGTKGLEGGSNKNAGLKDSWKLIKFVHVGKYVIWNIICGVVLLSLGASYLPRFFITIIMIGLMACSLALKILIGIVYMIKYKFQHCSCGRGKEQTEPGKSRIRGIIQSYKQDIESEIRAYLNDVSAEFKQNQFRKFGGSFIQASRTKKSVEKSFKKHVNLVASRSKIDHKPKKMSLFDILPTIIEEKESNKKSKYQDSEKSLESVKTPEKKPLNSFKKFNSDDRLMENKQQSNKSPQKKDDGDNLDKTKKFKKSKPTI